MKTVQKSINWGILGLGKIAHKFAGDLIKVPNAHLLAVGSRDGEKAKAFARQYGAEQVFDSYESLVTCDDLDIIYVATPHVFHMEHTLLCLSHGKHVLCEKPIAIHAAQATKMFDLAESRNLFLMEAIWTMFFPFMKDLTDMVKGDELGDIILIEADFGFKAPYDPESRIFNLNLGGGALLDIGIYPIFLSLAILGVPDEIHAIGFLGKTGVDETTSIRLKWNKGAMANLHCTLMAHTQISAKIYGSRGYVEIPRRWHESNSMKLWQGDELIKEFRYEDDYRGYAYEIMAVQDDLIAGRRMNQRLPPKFSLDLIGLLDKIRSQMNLIYPMDVHR